MQNRSARAWLRLYVRSVAAGAPLPFADAPVSSEVLRRVAILAAAAACERKRRGPLSRLQVDAIIDACCRGSYISAPPGDLDWVRRAERRWAAAADCPDASTPARARAEAFAETQSHEVAAEIIAMTRSSRASQGKKSVPDRLRHAAERAIYHGSPAEMICVAFVIRERVCARRGELLLSTVVPDPSRTFDDIVARPATDAQLILAAREDLHARARPLFKPGMSDDEILSLISRNSNQGN